MAWTVAQIISKFRDLTGRKSVNQISDADILIEINHFYQEVFPIEAGIPEFKGWYTFNTVASTGSQALPDTVLSVTFPAYVDDEEVTIWTDTQRFYEEYPHDYATENLPTDILLLDRTLILRPIPDDVYEARLRKTSSIPDALVTGEIDNPLWGRAIAYGSAITFLSDKGEKEIAGEHEPIYLYHLGLIRKGIILQAPTGKRPRSGRF